MINKHKVASMDINQMTLFIFDSFDSMRFIRVELDKDEVPHIFKKNTN